jgi:hypothetical protein
MTLTLDSLLSHAEKKSVDEKSLQSLVSVCVKSNLDIQPTHLE